MYSMPLPISPSAADSQTPKAVSPRPRPGGSWVWQILYILYCLEVGVLLIFLPWLDIWDNNYLLYSYPAFQPVFTNSYFKGAVLGLGLVNIAIGIQEIARVKRILRRPSST